MNEKSEYHCSICIKNYSSKSSLCNHTKKFHSKNVNQSLSVETSINNQPSSVETSIDNQPSSVFTFYTCRFCKKEYKHIQSRWKHEVKCKFENENKKEKENIMNLKNELFEKAQEIVELKRFFFDFVEKYK